MKNSGIMVRIVGTFLTSHVKKRNNRFRKPTSTNGILRPDFTTVQTNNGYTTQQKQALLSVASVGLIHCRCISCKQALLQTLACEVYNTIQSVITSLFMTYSIMINDLH